MYCTAVFRKMPSARRLVPGTLRWTPGRTLGRHQPPGGQHRCLRCTAEQIVDPVPVVPMLHVCAADSGTAGAQYRILLRCFRGTELLTFVLVEVFKVYNVDRVQQRFWSRSPCPQIQVEVFKIFSQSRVPQRLLRFLSKNKNGRKKGKKENRAQRGTPEMGPKFDFLHKNCL